MIRVFIACSGLGNIKRGFESFTQECFDALVNESSLQVRLFKGGGGRREKEIPLWNLPRNDWRSIQLGKLTRRGAYNIEQSTFFLSLLPYIYYYNPNIVYFSDINLGYALWHWRQRTKKRYKLLFSNGCPQDPPFPRWDHIQQLTPFEFQKALDAGVHSDKQSLVPYGFQIPSTLQRLTPLEKTNLRSKLGLPEDKPIILSVGLIDKSHKRMDYLIREIANLPKPQPYLLLLGQPNNRESHEVISLGKQLLGSTNFQVRTVESSEISDYYKIADIFVLASLREAFGRVFVEAMSHGLPCLAHDYPVTQYILEQYGYLANFELEESLTQLVHKVLISGNNESLYYFRHQSIYNRFSWDQLRKSYIEMIYKCAKI